MTHAPRPPAAPRSAPRSLHAVGWLAALVAASALVGCGQEPEPAPAAEQAPANEPAPRARLDYDPPSITLRIPKPGARLTREDGTIRVIAVVEDAGRGLGSVTVGGVAVPVDKGAKQLAIDQRIPIREGASLLRIVAEDAAGNDAGKDVAFVAADKWVSYGDALPEPIRVEASADALGPGEIGDAVRRQLAGVKLARELPDPLVTLLGHQVRLADVTHKPLGLRLTPNDGGLEALVVVPELDAQLTVSGTFSMNKRFSIARSTATLDMAFDLAKGIPATSVRKAEATIEGLDFGLPAWLDTLHDATGDAIASALTDELRAAVTASLSSQVAEVLRGFGRKHYLKVGDAPFIGTPTVTALSLDEQGASAEVAVAIDPQPRGEDELDPFPEIGDTRQAPDASAPHVPLMEGCGEVDVPRPDEGLAVHVPLSLVNALLATLHKDMRLVDELGADVSPAFIDLVDLEWQLPPLLATCDAPPGAVRLQVAALSVRTRARVKERTRAIRAELAFDVDLRVSLTTDGRLRLSGELVKGSLKASDPFVELIGAALVDRLPEVEWPPAGAPWIAGLKIQFTKARLDGRGLRLEFRALPPGAR